METDGRVGEAEHRSGATSMSHAGRVNIVSSSIPITSRSMQRALGAGVCRDQGDVRGVRSAFVGNDLFGAPRWLGSESNTKTDAIAGRSPHAARVGGGVTGPPLVSPLQQPLPRPPAPLPPAEAPLPPPTAPLPPAEAPLPPPTAPLAPAPEPPLPEFGSLVLGSELVFPPQAPSHDAAPHATAHFMLMLSVSRRIAWERSLRSPWAARPIAGNTLSGLRLLLNGRSVLTDITFEAKPGEMVALVGLTGAGKTTLVSLIPRFYDAQRGGVLIDGVDVRNYKIRSLRERSPSCSRSPCCLPAPSLTTCATAASTRPTPRSKRRRVRRTRTTSSRGCRRGYDTGLPKPAAACPAASGSVSASRARF